MGHAVKLSLARLTKADNADCKFLWHLRNQKKIRMQSFREAKILYRDHCRWFQKKIRDPQTSLYLVKADRGPIGQIRFERERGDAVVNIAMADRFRHKGYGSRALSLAMNRFLKSHRVKKMIAYVKESNRASKTFFEKLGYSDFGPAKVGGRRARHLVFKTGIR